MTGNRIRMALGVTFLGFVLFTGTAAADLAGNGCSTPCAPTGNVLGEEVTAQSPATAAPETVAAAPTATLAAEDTAPAGQLPFTGGDVAGMVIIGAVALGAGTVLVRRSRTATAK